VTGVDPTLAEALERARRLGFLGPGPVAAHLDHARAFAEAVESFGPVPGRALDLGSGGGVPGLVLAEMWPACHFALVESNQRRSRHLQLAVRDLGFEARVEVVAERAEVVAHDPRHRERYDLVTARGFGEPAATAEIAAGLLGIGGLLVVSEPPERRPERWPSAGTKALGYTDAEYVEDGGAHLVGLRRVRGAAPDEPRGVGRPAKRPRW
jgi:16S rRNA (guanine527-N7)-methyltransferase